MKEFKCKDCGAIFTTEEENIPEALICFCESKNFEIIEKKPVLV